MNRDLDSEIQRRIETFAKEMSDLMRAAALDAMEDALGGARRSVRAPAAAPRKSPGRPAGRKPGPKPGPKKAAPKKRRGGKRTSAELQKLEDDFLREVKKAGGRRIEEIGKSLGIKTKELALPVKKLMSEKKIKTTGQRRATRYFAK